MNLHTTDKKELRSFVSEVFVLLGCYAA